jgi:hypothetical protein
MLITNKSAITSYMDKADTIKYYCIHQISQLYQLTKLLNSKGYQEKATLTWKI